MKVICALVVAMLLSCVCGLYLSILSLMFLSWAVNRMTDNAFKETLGLPMQKCYSYFLFWAIQTDELIALSAIWFILTWAIALSVRWEVVSELIKNLLLR